MRSSLPHCVESHTEEVSASVNTWLNRNNCTWWLSHESWWNMFASAGVYNVQHGDLIIAGQGTTTNAGDWWWVQMPQGACTGPLCMWVGYMPGCEYNHKNWHSIVHMNWHSKVQRFSQYNTGNQNLRLHPYRMAVAADNQLVHRCSLVMPHSARYMHAAPFCPIHNGCTVLYDACARVVTPAQVSHRAWSKPPPCWWCLDGPLPCARHIHTHIALQAEPWPWSHRSTSWHVRVYVFMPMPCVHLLLSECNAMSPGRWATSRAQIQQLAHCAPTPSTFRLPAAQ